MDKHASFRTYVQVCNLETQLQKLQFFCKNCKSRKEEYKSTTRTHDFRELCEKIDKNPNSSKEEGKSLARTRDFCDFCESCDFLR